MKRNMSKKEAEDNVNDIMIRMSNKYWLAYVNENIDDLCDLGVYESFLLEAYTGSTINNHNWDSWELKSMFQQADREKLVKAGDPLPGPGPFKVFRGVAGRGKARKVKGISWTGDYEKAVWFAKRFECLLYKPMVYETIVQLEQVLVYSNARNEDEFLCLLPESQKLRRVWPDAVTE